MVDGGSLENCCTARYRGFESLFLRTVWNAAGCVSNRLFLDSGGSQACLDDVRSQKQPLSRSDNSYIPSSAGLRGERPRDAAPWNPPKKRDTPPSQPQPSKHLTLSHLRKSSVTFCHTYFQQTPQYQSFSRPSKNQHRKPPTQNIDPKPSPKRPIPPKRPH